MTWLTWPNRITIARILLLVPLVVCLLNVDDSRPSARRLALGLFCLLALPETAVSGARLPDWVPVLVIGKDLLLTLGVGLVYAATGTFFVQPRSLGKACTLVQSVTIVAVLLAPDVLAAFRRLLPGLYYLTGGLAAAAALDYLRIGNRFARQVHQESMQREHVDE